MDHKLHLCHIQVARGGMSWTSASLMVSISSLCEQIQGTLE